MTAFRDTLNYHGRIDKFRQTRETTMRKSRDFDAGLKALDDKAKELKQREVLGLGELVIATGADTLSAEELAGALVAIAETKDAAKREAWAKRGAAFFRSKSRRSAPKPEGDDSRAQTPPGGTQPPSGATGAD